MTVHPLARLLGSAEMARAFTLAALTAVFGSFAIGRMTSPVTLATVITALCLLGAAILWVRREELSPLRIAPSSLLAFLAWALVSLVWTTDRSDTVLGWLSLFGYAFLAITIGHIRDTLQTVRALGDTLRVLLGVSLGVEILSGCSSTSRSRSWTSRATSPPAVRSRGCSAAATCSASSRCSP